MARISKKKLSPEFKAQLIKILFENLEKVKSAGEAERFLDVFFTPVEKEIILHRLATIVLLNKGERYRKIQDELEISRNTISKAKKITSGDGYGRNLGKIIYSKSSPRKVRRKKLFRPYKGAESII